ncbi:MAG: hypothetical protein NUW37_07060 [Planctomycetes bacterium]|nr:hypothetical protein [Planctomycetota bacterium]
MNQENVIDWLLEGDPSIRYQVLRDIVIADKRTIEAERNKIAHAGWGAKLLSFQDGCGTWARQLYDHKWISTTYTLLLLMRMGLPPGNAQAHEACRELLDGGYREGGGICFAKTVDTVDNGVTAMVLAMLSQFGYPDPRVHEIADYLCKEQSPDGRWFPSGVGVKFRYHFDNTLLVLEGLREYEKRHPRESKRSKAAQSYGRDFLLRHHLFIIPETGAPIDKKFTLISFPRRWFYDVLGALDYFRESGAKKDPRLAEAIEVLRKKRNRDGTWNLQNPHPGKVWFEMEKPGKPSRWNTLRAMRVLKWWG